jgi:hypothetical protein
MKVLILFSASWRKNLSGLTALERCACDIKGLRTRLRPLDYAAASLRAED